MRIPLFTAYCQLSEFGFVSSPASSQPLNIPAHFLVSETPTRFRVGFDWVRFAAPAPWVNRRGYSTVKDHAKDIGEPIHCHAELRFPLSTDLLRAGDTSGAVARFRNRICGALTRQKNLHVADLPF